VNVKEIERDVDVITEVVVVVAEDDLPPEENDQSVQAKQAKNQQM
jgi:hypothetical protein